MYLRVVRSLLFPTSLSDRVTCGEANIMPAFAVQQIEWLVGHLYVVHAHVMDTSLFH